MRDDVEALWVTLRDWLAIRGDLPLGHMVMTPAEIAGALASASGDGRVGEFVWNYYYPHFYGQQNGAMSDDEARALVASFSAQSGGGQISPPAGPEGQSEPCDICHRRRGERVEQ